MWRASADLGICRVLIVPTCIEQFFFFGIIFQITLRFIIFVSYSFIGPDDSLASIHPEQLQPTTL